MKELARGRGREREDEK